MPPEERPVSRAEIPGRRKGLEEEENGAVATARGEVDPADEDGGGGDTASPNGSVGGATVDISAVMASVRRCHGGAFSPKWIIDHPNKN